MSKMQMISLKIFALFVMPIILIATNLISFYFLLPLTALVFVAVILDIQKEKWTLKDLGLRLDNFKQSLTAYVLFTATGLAITLLFSKAMGKELVPQWWTIPYFYLATIPFSFLQEFLYRGYLMKKLSHLLARPWQVIALNSLLFAFLHVIYPDALILFPFGFLTGVAFATMYYYYPNLILITLSHAILNLSVITHCFFSLPGQHGC